MRSSLLAIAAVAVASLAMTAEASPTTIGAFFDPGATDCDIAVAPFSTFNVYVSAVLGTDAAAAGIYGAEFRVDGLTDIVSTVTPSPASSLSLGNPTLGGCNIAFPACMTGEGPRTAVLLYTISCSVGQLASARTVTVSYHWAVRFDAPPWAPTVVLCDYPVLTKMNVSGGQALLNNGGCTVDVQPTTWSMVKALYAVNSVLQPPAPTAPRLSAGR